MEEHVLMVLVLIGECVCLDNFMGEMCEEAFCPDGWCYNEGICSVEDNDTICECNGCQGDRCEIDVDACSPDPCQNGGTCIDGVCSNFECICPPSHTGDNCEIDRCEPNPCHNGGTCGISDDDVVCECPSGYSGEFCEDDLDHCSPETCKNAGTCVEGDGVLVSCICPDCFDGDFCENDLEYCIDSYCKNGGTCVDGYGCDYSCNCTETYQGERCETAFCPDGWCFNEGVCSVIENEVSCECNGCSGDRCENDPDVCTLNTCQNGGTCNEGLCNTYTCDCTDEFTGDNCETPICQPDSCKNGGNCSVSDNVIVCECAILATMGNSVKKIWIIVLLKLVKMLVHVLKVMVY